MNQIVMSDESKKKLIEAIQIAVGVSTNEFLMDNNLITFNCIHMLKWDKINTYIANNMNQSQYDIKKFSRGIFCPILIYDKENKNLYLPMRYKNLVKLKKERNKRKIPHYMDALVTKNSGIKVAKDQQEFFDTDNVFDKDMIDKILAPINEIEVNNFIVCAFEEIQGELISVRAIILDTNLREYHSEDWSHFIDPTYIHVGNITNNPDSDPDDDYEILIKDTSTLNINKKDEEKEEENENS